MTVFQAGKLSVERSQTALKSLKYVHVISLYDIIMLVITLALDSGFGQNRTVNLWSICLHHWCLIFTRDGQMSPANMVTVWHATHAVGSDTLGIPRLNKWKCYKTWARSVGKFLQPPQTRYISAQPPR